MQRLRTRLTPLLSQLVSNQVSREGEATLQTWACNNVSKTSLIRVRNLQTAAEMVETLDKAPVYMKTKKLTKTAAHIMQILDREAVTEAKALRPVPELRPGDVVQLKVEVPENKRRNSTFRGIVMAIRRSGVQSTFRIRRFLAGVGVELLFPLYSPNIKELKVLEHRRVRRNKLYYMRDKLQDKRNKIT
ncbi:hypothetical protein L7F22_012426 [Adiantum nelumboides]|nr:hypothetical protein [Adiantum nelumboides]